MLDGANRVAVVTVVVVNVSVVVVEVEVPGVVGIVVSRRPIVAVVARIVEHVVPVTCSRQEPKPITGYLTPFRL